MAVDFIRDSKQQEKRLSRLERTEQKSSASGSQRDYLPNGGFEAWSLGNGPIVGNSGGVIGPDGWYLATMGTTTISGQKNTTVVDGSNGISAQFTVAAVVADSASAIVNPHIMTTTLTAYYGQQLASKIMTVRFRVAPGNVGMRVRALVYADSIPGWLKGPLQVLASGYQDVDWTFSFPSSSTTVYVGLEFEDNGNYFVDNSRLVLGSSVQGTYEPRSILEVPGVFPANPKLASPSISGIIDLATSNPWINGWIRNQNAGQGLYNQATSGGLVSQAGESFMRDYQSNRKLALLPIARADIDNNAIHYFGAYNVGTGSTSSNSPLLLASQTTVAMPGGNSTIIVFQNLSIRSNTQARPRVHMYFNSVQFDGARFESGTANLGYYRDHFYMWMFGGLSGASCTIQSAISSYDANATVACDGGIMWALILAK